MNACKHTTPIKIKIASANHMVDIVYGIGYAKNQFSGDEFQEQLCRGTASWYADKIGQKFEVLPFSDKFVRVNNDAGCGFFFIDVRDVEFESLFLKAEKRRRSKQPHIIYVDYLNHIKGYIKT